MQRLSDSVVYKISAFPLRDWGLIPGLTSFSSTRCAYCTSRCDCHFEKKQLPNE